MDNNNPRQIEPKILPLVKSINNLGIVRTFSSCQGHYEDYEQDFMDRNKADVRYKPIRTDMIQKAEHFTAFMVSEFYKRHKFSPITLHSFKLYVPESKYQLDFVFVIELIPFDRFENPLIKRRDTDLAIVKASAIVDSYCKKYCRLESK